MEEFFQNILNTSTCFKVILQTIASSMNLDLRDSQIHILLVNMLTPPQFVSLANQQK